MTAWTDERVARLRQLMADGLHSCSQAAEALGGITRNAVVGKCHRMGIPIIGNPARGKETRRMNRKADGLKKRSVTPRPIMPIAVTMPTDKPEPDGTVTIMGLTNETCRWPMLDRPPQVYCGKPEADVAAGVPYCHEHSCRATGLNTPRKVQYFNKGIL